MSGGHIGLSSSSRFAATALRFVPPGDDASPMRRFVSMVFGETSRPAGRLVSPKTMATKSLGRAQGSRLARDPRSRLGLDAEPGSGTADQEDLELRCMSRVGFQGEGMLGQLRLTANSSKRWPRETSGSNQSGVSIVASASEAIEGAFSLASSLQAS